MKKALLQDGKLEIGCDMFIVPNSLNRASAFSLNAGRFKESANAVLAANGLATESDPLLIQIWVVAEESMGCDNLNDHFGLYKDADGNESLYGQVWGYLPASLFKDAKEGDTVEVIIPSGVYGYSDDFDTVLCMTLAQTVYRYRRFGNFEDCFKCLYAKAV